MDDIVQQLISQGHPEHSAQLIANERAKFQAEMEALRKQSDEKVKLAKKEARRFKKEAKRSNAKAERNVSFAEQTVLNAIHILREHEDGCGQMLNQMLELYQWMKMKISEFQHADAQEDDPADHGPFDVEESDADIAMVVGNDGTRHANGFHVGSEGGTRDGVEVDRCYVNVSHRLRSLSTELYMQLGLTTAAM
jgi:hypothetical protein